MPPVNLLIKPASGNCNMRCDYCFYCDEAEKRSQKSYGMMSDKTLKNVIRKSVLAAERNCTIAFQGGEPTLCGIEFFRKMVAYTKHYNKNGIQIDYALQTNGLEITEEWCRFFAENNFLIGLSVDGLEKIHDTYRHNSQGGDTFERILETSRMFERYDVQYNILTVVHKETAIHVKEIYREYKKRKWEWLQFITCLDPLGEERGKQEYSLLPEVYGQFLIDLFKLWYEDFLHGIQPYIRQFENYVSILLGCGVESCEQRGICGIQNVVEANGNVYPCDFYVLDEYCLGNLNDNSMKEIDQKRKEMGFMERSRNHPEECRACQWFSLCRGGCYRSRITNAETAYGWNYFCRGYKLFFETCGEQLKEVARYTYTKMKKNQ